MEKGSAGLYKLSDEQKSAAGMGYCQIKFATLDSVYHVTLPVYPVI